MSPISFLFYSIITFNDFLKTCYSSLDGETLLKKRRIVKFVPSTLGAVPLGVPLVAVSLGVRYGLLW